MKKISLTETFGLSPVPLRAREAWLALRGAEGVPASRFDLSSLGVLTPTLSVKTWLGRRRADRRIPISNLFNHTQTPLSAGWSVRKTQVRDFRGGTLTYDSHNGTDFVIPVGTTVVAPAPGRVLRISSEFNRGGLKLFLDHGRGLTTTCNHLARPLVQVGEEVARGAPIALSGYSGLDGFAAFPWSAPHVHFSVWLNGASIDPFSAGDERPIWREGNDPLPSALTPEEPYEPTPFEEEAVTAAIEACSAAEIRALLAFEPRLDRRAMNVQFHRNYYPTRFTATPPLHAQTFPREPRLTLPFSPDDFTGLFLPPVGG